jgi:hypothetical protein
MHAGGKVPSVRRVKTARPIASALKVVPYVGFRSAR